MESETPVKYPGKGRLYLGDCLEVMDKIPSGKIDMVLADPPYGTTQCKWDSTIPFEPMWMQLDRVAKESAAIVMTASQPFTSALVMSNREMFRYEWVWIKNRGGSGASTVREPLKEHESVLVFSKGKWTYNKQMQARTGGGLDRVQTLVNPSTGSDNWGDLSNKKSTKYGDLRTPSSWQKFNLVSGSEKTKHPTQKPVALMAYLIKTYTNEGETVLDFTIGSGTTAIAAIDTKRRFVGIEKDPEIFETAKKRIDRRLQENRLL